LTRKNIQNPIISMTKINGPGSLGTFLLVFW
jgi:hypothetical protein